MAEHLPDVLLSQLSNLVATQMGLYFPIERRHDLERGIVAVARAFGFADGASCGQWLLSGPLTRAQVEALANHLTVGETYFFREQATFKALQERLVPDLVHARRESGRRLRVWSAGCCTGEEPYSIAILLSQLIPDWQEWSVTILATDINPQFLHKAVEGVYGEWSFRGLPPPIKERYFRKTADGRYEILPQIRERVTFSFLNLANDVYPTGLNQAGEMDVIFCRNVLMYFAPEQAKKVARALYHSLAEDGWLIPGLSEASHVLFSKFKPVRFPDAVLYQKKSTGADEFRRMTPLFVAPEEGRSLGWPVMAPADPEQSDPVAPDLGALVAAAVDTVEEAETPVLSLRHGLVLYEQGRYAEAETQTHHWLLEHPEDVQAIVLMARIYANQGRLDEALAWGQRAVAADPLSLGSHYLFATIRQERGEIEEAVKSFKRVLYLDPDFAPAHFALGYLARGRRGADRHFANAVAILRRYRPEELLPESDGLTAGRLLKMVETIRSPSRSEKPA